MRARMLERGAMCRVEWLASINDKPSRARSFQGMASMGKVFVPANAAWIGDVLAELIRFPAGKHDDSVDVCGLIGRGLQFIGTSRRPALDFSTSAAQGSRM